jgi:HD-like signal output (HDOD) protein
MQAQSEISEAERIAKDIGIPACPGVLANLAHAAAQDKPDLSHVCRLIARDAELSAAVLKAVNSPLYGSTFKAGTVGEAVNALAPQRCASLVARLMLPRAFTMLGEPALSTFWNSASQLGLMVAYLARELGVADFDDAHTFGVFRDCGAPLMMAKFPGYQELFEATHIDGTQNVSQTERASYGIDHASVGALLATSWGLPKRIWLSISMHHRRSDTATTSNGEAGFALKLVAVGALADCITMSHRTPVASAYWQGEQEYAYRVLGLRPDEADALRADVSLLLESP